MISRSAILNKARKELYKRKRNATNNEPFLIIIGDGDEVPSDFKGIIVHTSKRIIDGVECKK